MDFDGSLPSNSLFFHHSEEPSIVYSGLTKSIIEPTCTCHNLNSSLSCLICDHMNVKINKERQEIDEFELLERQANEIEESTIHLPNRQNYDYKIPSIESKSSDKQVNISSNDIYRNNQSSWGAVTTKPMNGFNNNDDTSSIASSNRDTTNQTTWGAKTTNAINRSINNDDNSSIASSNKDINRSVSASRRRSQSAIRPVIKPPKSLHLNNTIITPKKSISSTIKQSNNNTPDKTVNLSDLSEKAKQLEEEIETYKKENQIIKQLRKQQELALEEINKQKIDSLQYITNEKLKCDKICEENKQNSLKDRRFAAKLLRDAKLKLSNPIDSNNSNNNTSISNSLLPITIRDARNEIEALNTTIEKLKLDSNNYKNKSKLNENRLHVLIKDLNIKIKELENLNLLLENDKNNLYDWIDDKNIKLPNHLKRNKSNKKSEKRNNHIDSYIEEIYEPEKLINNNVTTNISNNLTAYESNIIDSPIGSKSLKVNSDNIKLNVTDDLRLSWARSSKSSRGSRYSSYSNNNDNDDIDNNEDKNNSNYNNTNVYDDHIDVSQSNNQINTSTSQTNNPMNSLDNYINKFTTSINKQLTNDFNNSHVISPSSTNKSPLASTSTNRIEEILPDGTTLIKYRNGTEKRIYKDGRSLVTFTNGDTKSIDSENGIVIYYYAEAKTTHTTYPDGLQIYEFPNGQIEKHFSSGKKEISFPDGTKKIIYADGIQESYFNDGVAIREYPDDRKEIIADPMHPYSH